MSLRRTQPYKFSPRGLSDALDGSNVFSGACARLQNLIPDPTTKNLWTCRPASIEETDFDSFDTPAAISVMKIIGNVVYGMIASDTTPGFDEPFAYDLIANAFVAITGVTGANVPVSPASSGVWTPPTMALVGTMLLITHPGFASVAGCFFGWLDLTNPAAPAYSAGNFTGALSANAIVPKAVIEFNSRAWWALASDLAYSDALVPRNFTAAGQVLSLGDNTDVTALGALPLNNQLGGIVQAIIAFKGTARMFQIKGDAVTLDLSVNALEVPTGTLAPLSVCSTPKGLAFMAPDGIRVVDAAGGVSDPIGMEGMGVTVPFIYSNVPSRVAAACGNSVYRISTQNANALGTPWEEYWFDFSRGIWSGPHTFPAAMIQPWINTFVMAPVGVPAKLFVSDVVQSATSTYEENDTQILINFQTVFLPDTDQMSENAMLETTIMLALAPATTYGISAVSDQGTSLDTALLQGGDATVWGAFVWGQALWQGAANALRPRAIEWSTPVVFRRLAINIQGQCAAGFKLGDVHLRYEMLGYLQQMA